MFDLAMKRYSAWRKIENPQEFERFPRVEIHVDGYGVYHLKHISKTGNFWGWIPNGEGCTTLAQAEKAAQEFLHDRAMKRRVLIETIS